MRAQLASDFAEDRSADSWARFQLASAPSSFDNARRSYDSSRTIYGETRRINPVAAAASAAVAVGALALFLHIGQGHHRHHQQQHHLTVVQLADLQPPPPPPPQAQEKVQPPQEQPSLVVPQAIVPLPAPTTPVATVTQPKPPVVSTATVAVRGPATAAPAPSQDPANVADMSARMISATPPSYPLEARRFHEEGTVVLSVLLGIDGRVANISISRSSGSRRLDQAALSAVKRWRWAPLVRNGAAVAVQGLVTIPFVLRT